MKKLGGGGGGGLHHVAIMCGGWGGEGVDLNHFSYTGTGGRKDEEIFLGSGVGGKVDYRILRMGGSGGWGVALTVHIMSGAGDKAYKKPYKQCLRGRGAG